MVISKTNNISDIQLFAYAVLEFVKQCPISVVLGYATLLNQHIDCFDIPVGRNPFALLMIYCK